MTYLTSDEISNDRYVLPRNEVEGGRLQNQHQILTEVFDGRLIIDETIKLKEGDRVLDSGTGAASWILDLVKIAPKDVDFVGIDISSAMFPPDTPKNVSLYEKSFMDLPSSWDNSFDLVNQRLVIAALTKEQWQTTISGLFRILKAGGAIQLIEAGRPGTSNELDTPPATKQCGAYCSAMFEKRNLLGYGCRSQLPILLKEAGFVDVHVEDKKVPLGKHWGKLGDMIAQNWDGVVRTFGSACLAEGGLGVCGSEAEVESVVEQAKKEWDEIPGIFVEAYAITARKPL